MTTAIRKPEPKPRKLASAVHRAIPDCSLARRLDLLADFQLPHGHHLRADRLASRAAEMRETAQLSDAINPARHMGSCVYVPILEAVRAGRVARVFVTRRDGMASNRTLKTIQRAVLVIVGDDDYSSTGPAGWPTAAPLMRWTRAVMAHGAGAEPDHYRAAVASTEAHGRFVLVETSSEHVPAWMACAADRVAVAIVPRNGPHPVLPSRGPMH